MGSKIEGGQAFVCTSVCAALRHERGVPSHVVSPNGSNDFRMPPSPGCDWIPLSPAMSREGDGWSDRWPHPPYTWRVMMKPHRVPLYDFPDVVLHSPELVVKGHPQYRPAKIGDPLAAEALVADSISDRAVEQLAVVLSGQAVVLVPIHALESEGVNEIPIALAEELSRRL